MEQENQKNKLTKKSKENGIKSVKRLKNNLLMRSKKETRGITLIALVITIIVLLILAGVAIATLLGDNGIITRATTAKEKTQQAGAVERVQMEVQGSYGTDGLLDYKELQKNLNNVQGIDKSKIPSPIESTSFPIKVTVDGTDVEIKENGEVKLAFNAKEWDKTACKEDSFYWESDIEGQEGYNTIIGYTSKIDNYTKLRFPSRCKKIEFRSVSDYGDGVGTTESRAFTNNIEKIEIPSTVTSIGNWAFGDRGDGSFKELKEVDIKDGVISIQWSAFYGCEKLANITIPNSVTNIGSDAFYDTAWYNNQPDGLAYAGKVAYKYKGEMPSDTSLQIKEGTKGIAENAFSDCTNVTNITIPNSVINIGKNAFYDCTGLTEITIPDSVTYIGESAFCGCTGLTEITIPSSVTSMGIAVFMECTNLTKITIPDSVTSIGDGAFCGCTGLTEITIPSSVTSIENDAFAVISENAVFHVVKDSYADKWLRENKEYESQTIKYITE